MNGDTTARWREALATTRSSAPLGVYVHVPYCASRCGYCDFNTYTAAELGPGVRQETYADDVLAEVALARSILGERAVSTVFFGGGTPTLLPAGDLTRVIAGIDRSFPLVVGAEVTTEANPDSVDRRAFEELLAGGFTRISLGMQSAAAQVLHVLERSHTPGRSAAAAREAKAVGFQHVSLDLIYGTPGETDEQWRTSLQTVIDTGVDHVSAYALTVEPSTPLGRAMRRGAFPTPDPDVAASRYEVAARMLEAAGLQWYEISNFARPAGQCRHNLGYWSGADWWGFGPGAHSHVGGVRWWNVKHPRTYAAALAAGRLPIEGFEVLSADERALEDVMLGLRLRTGLSTAGFDESVIAQLRADGLVAVSAGRVSLTLPGRMLADRVTLSLMG